MHRVRQPRSDRFPKGGQYNIQLTHPAKDGSNVDCELHFKNPDEAARLNLHKFIITERGVELPGANHPGYPRDNPVPVKQKKKKPKAKRSRRQKATEPEAEKAVRKQANQKTSPSKPENAKKDQATVDLTSELRENKKDQQTSRPSSKKLSTVSNRVRPSLSVQPDYAVNIFTCLDRFSLDSVGFTCSTLKGIVDKHLHEEPLRVLESVTIEWDDGLIAKLVPESPLGQTMTIYYGKKMLRRTAALCANSFVKFFKIGEGGDWRAILHTFGDYLPGIRIGKLMTVDYKFELVQRVVQLTRGVESLLMKTRTADVGTESLQCFKEHGVRRLAVYGAYHRITEEGVRAFCIGGPETVDKDAPNRSIYLRGTDLSFEFLQQLAQECLATDASRMPTVTFDRYGAIVPPLPEHLAQARHTKYGRPCLHFRFDAAAGPYEIVAQSRGCEQWKVTLRGSHSAVPHCAKMCRRETWFRELEEIDM